MMFEYGLGNFFCRACFMGFVDTDNMMLVLHFFHVCFSFLSSIS